MLFILITMLVIVAVAGLVLAYAAFPHRGEELPVAPWLGEAMNTAADRLPTLEPEDGHDWSPHRDASA
ncbi:hypothetical protein [Nocardioides sp. CER19]|uniref:hypothetical protein n=1 Tax=Nocardioides sp. CER19 TaxID=3038538 RepID=UPI00244ADCC4|nr:hypothetical protein [Nocardioides sp. CER19]MDH2416917.1 hypothetical protein [Nocardioides sp. CER19]